MVEGISTILREEQPEKTVDVILVNDVGIFMFDKL